MTSTRYVCTALLALTHALWLPQCAQAQRPGDEPPHKGQQHGKHPQDHHAQQMQQMQQESRERQRAHRPAQQPPHMSAPSSAAGQIAIGGYFQQQHLEAARSYYGRPENMGFCPPGLAKKGTGCLPPGQAKPWRKGAPLRPGVIYYDVPRAVVLSFGVPPAGYKYVRVASDILLIAVGTSLVIDAMEDLVR